MALSQTAQYCSGCGAVTLHQRGRFGVGWGLALTLLTGGMFIPIWILIAIVDGSRPYNCVHCKWPVPQGAPALGRTGMASYPTPDATPEATSVGSLEATTRRSNKPFPTTAQRPGPRPCPTCTAVMPASARFCRECGTALHADLATSV